MMNFSATQIAAIINGQIEGNTDVAVDSFGKIEEAVEGQLVFLANPKYEEYIYTTQATIVIINQKQELRYPVAATLIRVADAYSSFAVLLDAYQKIQQQQLIGIQQPVYIDATAKTGDHIFIGAFSYLGKNVILGDNVKIYPNVFLGDEVVIGENSIIHPGVKIYHQCIIGKNVNIHAGTIIGSDGFGFAPLPDGTFKKIPQIGNVIIEDGVEIGSNCTIDRATIGSTVIKSGAKLDNLLQIAHNVEVGSNTVIAAQSGVSGSTKIGKNVKIGGQVGIVGHITIGDGVKINAQSGVSKSLEPGKIVTGSPAHDFTAALRSQAASRKLPEMDKRIKQLEDLVKELSQKK